MEETDEVPWDLYKEMGRQQYMGILTPKEFGGSAMGHLARMIMLEEIGRVSAANAMAMQIFHLGIVPIVEFGNDAQKKKYLPALAKGERLATIAVTEATGGSDPTGCPDDRQVGRGPLCIERTQVLHHPRARGGYDYHHGQDRRGTERVQRLHRGKILSGF